MEPLKREFLELLDRDLEFRYAVAGYLGLSEILKRLDTIAEEQTNLREEQTKIWSEIRTLREEQTRIWEEIKALREEQTKLREEQTKIWEEIKALREEQTKLREEQTKIWEEVKALREEQANLREEQTKIWEEIKALREEQLRLREDMKRGFESMRRHIDALGARWGIISEQAFREGLRGILEEELGLKVEKWVRRDDGGFVFGYPSIIDVDLAIHDGRIILVEVKSHADKRDIYDLKRKAEFYKIVEGKEPHRLIIVTPYADEEALEAAEQMGIEIYTRV
ncbi:MAG: DUF3782 domain-containing protein [Candidatus Bathyarchaeota archaeon]|nr:DUF3782 domain-containing protein [Candidatus Bathyarchaeota archaeon]